MVAKNKHKLRMKSTNYLDDIKSTIVHFDEIHSVLFNFICASPLAKAISHPQSQYCRKGIIRLLIFTKVLGLSSVNKLMCSELSALIPFGKDVIYNIRNSHIIDWRKLLLNQSYESLNGIEINASSKSADQTPCFIIDDSDIEKRGWHIEFIGKIYSHVFHKCILGFKSLNLAYWTGKNLIHIDFSLHSELGKKKDQGLGKKKLKTRFSKTRPQGTPGLGRAEECYEKKTKVALRMLKKAMRKGFNASYILADSWFFNKEMVKFSIVKKGHLISRPKFNNWKYVHSGKPYTIGQLCHKNKYSKAKKWSRKLRLHYVELEVEFQGHPVKLFFYKSKKRGTKWHAIITTDTKIKAIKVFEIYQNRWSIEISYKELKQHLNYGNCQSTDFDAQISDTTQTLMAYNFLSQTKTINDYQSIGALFEEISTQWISPTVMQRFWQMIFALLEQIAELFDLSNYLLD